MGTEDTDTELDVPSESREERRKRLRAGVVTLDRAILDYEEVEWLIDGLVPRGALIILAGEAKLARKTLLTMSLSLDIAEGQDFLGKKTQSGSVLFGNLEDGYKRSVRRFYQFGVREGLAPKNLSLLKKGGTLDYILEYIHEFKPLLTVLDPVVELELQTGVQSENDAREVARMLKLLRDAAQDTDTSIVAVHHNNKAGDIRGSTAFKGSCDGWWEIVYRRNKPRILRWTLRDGPEGEVDIDVNFDDDIVSVKTLSDFRKGHSTGGGRQQQSKEGPGWSEKKLAVAEKIRKLLEGSEKAVSRNEIVRRVRSSRRVVAEVLKQFEEDAVVKETGTGWVYCPSTVDLL